MTTSNARAYVYLQLPDSLEVVTAGRSELEMRSSIPTGTFVYSPTYLRRKDAVPLEPFELPLRPGRFETVKLHGMFGSIRDASPDAWGRRIIERHLGRVDLTEIDYLLHSPEDRAGSLSFGRGKMAPAPTTAFNRVVDLPALLAYAEAMDNEQPAPDDVLAAQFKDLINPGTSLGGARPKNVVEDDKGLWVAKFPERTDRWNNARVEASMLALAQECGIRAAANRVVKVGAHDVLLVKRFDRKKVRGGHLRHRMVSALTLLGAEDSYADRSKWNYLLLADEVRRRSARPSDDLVELYRRIVFNALISNTDDHPRNHAMIAPSRDWELSPAYDLTPNPLTSLEKRDLAMTAGRFNRYANRENLLSECAQFRLAREDAAAIIDRMMMIVRKRWQAVMRAHRVAEAECERLATSFDYPGFQLDPETTLATIENR